MSLSELPKIIETPNHFYCGSVDLPFVIGPQGTTQIKKLSSGVVEITVKMAVKSYKFDPNDDGAYYHFAKSDESDNK